VTHLPQLAAYGDQHLQVQKVQRDGRTVTIVQQMKGRARTIELAQMLGEVSEGTLQSATEILEAAQNAKS
jgi:DNA repair protein RecN (Recombination protein N)